MATSRSASLKLYGRLLRQARLYWPHMAGLFLISLLATPLALLAPLPLKIVFDSVLDVLPLPGMLDTLLPAANRSPTGVLVLAAGLMVTVAVLTEIRHLGSEFLGTYVGERLRLGFRASLFRHVQRLSLSYHDTRGTADSSYRIEFDASSIKWVATYGVTPFVTAGFTLCGMILVTWRIDWQLALVALGISPVLFLITHTYSERLRAKWSEAKKLESSALSVVQEVLTSLRVVKAFGREDREEGRFLSRSAAGMRARIRLTFIEGSFTLLVGLTLGLGTAAVLFIGASHVRSGIITQGDLLLVMGYLLQLYTPLKTISGSVVTLQSSLAGAERAFGLLDEAPEVPERADARPLALAAGAVTFRGVSFAYDGRDPVVRDISFEIAPGTRLGISGATGAGKTTLVSLLVRFYDPTAGQILLDGVDLCKYKLADLRNQFGIVLQEPVLFSTTVAENIAYARPEANEREIAEAAKAANAHDFIMALPDGYDTLVGERGMRLSGGERQRISLARAFLKDAPILILDEPTSAVDMKTEAAIMEAMERLMRGRTTFMIAHRLTTLANCDMRLEIYNGRASNVTRLTSLAADGT